MAGRGKIQKLRRKAAKRQGMLCYWCQTPMVHSPRCKGGGIPLNKATAERLVPGSKGGKYEESNVVAACHDCNTRRGNMPVDEFRTVVRCDALVAQVTS